MSKFFAKASEMSESESSSGSEDEVSTQPQKEVVKKTVAAPKKSYYKGYEESSESEEENRVVKSQKDKRLEQVDNIIKDTKNHVKINDFSSLQTDFDKLTEEIVRSAHLVFEEGKDGILPTYIVRTLVHIEDAINNVTSE